MRDEQEQRVALECLQLATSDGHATVLSMAATSEQVVARAEAYYAFVMGEAEDGARAKLHAVREALS